MNPVRIMIARRRTDWWDPTSDFATKPGRLINLTAQVIAVDPATTSPNVIVGVTMAPGQDPIYLRPGESIVLPTLTRQVWISNPALQQSGLGFIAGSNSTPLGMVGLLVGTTADLIAWKSRANRTRPSITAAVLAAGPLSATAPSLSVNPPNGTPIVPVAGLEVMRVRLVPLTAGGVIMEPPADLAGTIRIHSMILLPVDDAGVGVYNTASYRGTVDPDTGRPISILRQVVWASDPSQDFAIGQNARLIDYEVGVGDLAYVQIVGLAGTGVGSLLAIVEGG